MGISGPPFRDITTLSAQADPPSPAGPLVSGRATGAASAGDFYTPEALVRFMCGLLDIKGGSLYDPCCGSGALLIGAARSLPESAPRRLYGQAADAWTYQLCRMNLLLEGLFADLGGRPANALTEDLHPDRRFDFILANPPFNLPHWCEDVRLLPDTLWQYGPPPRSNANFAWLQHIIRHMADESRAAVLLPNGALTSQTRAERQIREGIVRDGLVEAVLALPAGLFYCTKIPCSLWLLHKTHRPASSVLLVDARERSLRGADGDGAALTELVLRYRAGEALESAPWYAVVPAERIAANRALVSPNLYTAKRPLRSASFIRDRERFLSLAEQLGAHLRDERLAGKIAMWAHASACRRWESAALTELYEITGGVVKKKGSFGHGIPMADLKTVICHPFLPEELTQAADLSEAETEKYRLRAGDILMGRTSESVRQLGCCCVVPEDRNAVCSYFLKRLRPYEPGRPDSLYMAGFFQSAIYRRQVEQLAPVYTTRVNVNLDMLSRITVYYPDAQSQKDLGSTLHCLYLCRQQSADAELNALLDEFVQLLIGQFITCPILRQEEAEA